MYSGHFLIGNTLDVLARIPLWKYGLDYRHGTGHGIGSFLNVHEGKPMDMQYYFHFNSTTWIDRLFLSVHLFIFQDHTKLVLDQ